MVTFEDGLQRATSSASTTSSRPARARCITRGDPVPERRNRPATLDRLAGCNPADPFRRLVPECDMVLTYAGGEPVVRAYEMVGARMCVPGLQCSGFNHLLSGDF